MKNYKIILHWNRIKNKWSVHYRGKCYLYDEVYVHCASKTEYKPEKKDNPRAFITCHGVLYEINMGVAEIRQCCPGFPAFR